MGEISTEQLRPGYSLETRYDYLGADTTKRDRKAVKPSRGCAMIHCGFQQQITTDVKEAVQQFEGLDLMALTGILGFV